MALVGTIVPDNTLSFRNRIINGEIRIDQRNAGANTVPSNNDYLADRFQINFAGSFAYQQNRGSVTPPEGFTNYLGIGATGSNSGSSALYAIRQNIEGNNIADLGWGTANAKTVTLSFWVRSNITGTYAVAFRSETGRSRLETYTISAANTWEYKTITVPGDTSGTWNTNTSTGLAVWFCYGGQNNQGPTGTWATADYRTVSGQANAVATNNDYFYITGVQLEVGSVATPFERRPYGMELALCQRYFFTIRGADIPIASGGMQTTTNFVGLVKYPVEMRGTPTLTASNTADHFRVFIDQSNAGNPSTVGVNIFGGGSSGFVLATLPSPVTQGLAGALRTLNANSFLNFSAEL